TDLKKQLQENIEELKSSGLYKVEREIDSAQQSHIESDNRELLNFCANNYLGLANDPRVIKAAKEILEDRGFGVASVRFICGTQDIHKDLETEVSKFLGTDDTILFSSCFDANGGVFEALFGEPDAIISDELNHASIIDGIRLSKAARFRYLNRDMADLERCLKEASSARNRIIVTDGIFSMDGYLAPLKEICALAKQYNAIVMVDDSHAVGLLGNTGAGTPELAGVSDQVDIYTGTFGKALGGAAGGYVSGRKEIIEYLRQKARPYLFSNSLAPAIVAGSLASIRIANSAEGVKLREKLHNNAKLFRSLMSEAGFELLEGEHPIIPVMFGDAPLAVKVANEMFRLGVYVTAFSYPVVPKGKARIRVQLSAAHSEADIKLCVGAFIAARERAQN
ncbi:MAG: glycine C-acetyltransferase, partial [Microbacteriaceae bacterium]|nr:glycine C-acetyltransferase [Microbacteriaceae bacterium]